MKFIALALAGLCAAPALAGSGYPVFPAAPALPDSAVADALKTFEALASDPMSLKEYGFGSAAEVGLSVVSEALPQYYVGLDKLASYKKGQNPQSLMIFDTEALLVEEGGQARAVIMLRYFNPPAGSATAVAPGWRLASIEGPVVAKAIKSILDPWKSYADKFEYLIYVPALGEATFVGSRAARQTWTAGQAYTLFDNGDLGMKAGGSKSVEDVFKGLQPKAQAEMRAPHNGPGA